MLAKALGQLLLCWLNHRIREQARSHMGCVQSEISGNPKNARAQAVLWAARSSWVSPRCKATSRNTSVR